jgi:hypothetical protein
MAQKTISAILAAGQRWPASRNSVACGNVAAAGLHAMLGKAWPWQLHSWQLAAKSHGSSIAGNVAMAAYVFCVMYPCENMCM